MFFDRLGRNDASSSNLLPRRTIAALSVAVALAVPCTSSLLLAEDAAPEVPVMAAELPAASPDELLKTGKEQYNAGQYEEAAATLQQIDIAQLPEGNRAEATDLLAKAESAATERRAARAEFELGQAALSNNQPGEAMVHFRAASDNQFADEGTKRKANEQIAVAQAAQKGEAGNLKSLYKEAAGDYKAGDYAAAKDKFTQLQASGFKAGLFQRSPNDYLKDIDKKMVQQANAESKAALARSEAEAAAAAKAQAEAEAQARAEEAARAEEQARTQLPADEPAAQPAPAAEPVAAEPAPAPAAEPMAAAEPAPAPAPAAAPAAAAPVAAAPADAAAPAPSEDDLKVTADLERMKREQDVIDAAAKVEAARAAEEKNNFAGALDLYSEALALDPSNEQAAAGRDQMLTLTGRAPQTSPLLDRQQQLIQIRKQEITYSVDTQVDKANASTVSGDFVSAQRAVDAARVARDSDPTIFTEQELNAFDSKINQAQLSLRTAQQNYAATEAAKQTADAAKTEAERQKRLQEERDRTVADLIKTSQQLITETKYREALGVIEQILAIDPNNAYASAAKPLVTDKMLFHEQRQYREQFDIQFTTQMNAADEAQIPYSEILKYPANWPDISDQRDRSVAQERGLDAEDAIVQEQLNRRLPEVRFDAVGFSDVVDFLRDITGANVFVNWRALEAVGIDRTTPVTARLRDVKFTKALDVILKDIGGGDPTTRLGYTIDEGVITISTMEDLSQNVVTQTYDIRDLIIDLPDFTDAPDFNLESTNTGSRSSGGGGGGGGGQSLFDGGGSSEDEDEQRTRQELIDEIIRLVTETVSPDSWRDNGGSVGAIRELTGQLIVTQTPDNQQQLSDLLEQLREQRAVQVTVEARFLTVTRNFLEDVGFDADFIFNPDGFDDDGTGWSPIPVIQQQTTADGGFTSGVGTGVPNSLTAGSIDPSVIVSGTYLDDFQVNFLLKATQASQNSSLVTAPRVTLFNGQRAYVLVATQQSYVSDLTPVVADNAVGYDATVDIVESGVLLDVQATVSSDRKYVTLTLRPQLSTLISLDEFSFVSGDAVQDQDGDDDDDDDDDDVDPNSLVATIQVPTIQITEVRTTVSVPDGGTLLLGGQTIAGEAEREQGVPVLSKIPFLKRLFTNRSTAKDENVLLILVKPTIIIQREQEQKQFPLLSTRVSGN